MRVLSEALKADNALRSEVNALSRVFLKRDVSGCSSCWTDAYLELIHLSNEIAMERTACKFELRAGVQIWLGNNYYTNANLTDKVALDWINKDPKRVEMFRVLPENIDTMLSDFVREKSGVKPAPAKPAPEPAKEPAPQVEQKAKPTPAERMAKARAAKAAKA